MIDRMHMSARSIKKGGAAALKVLVWYVPVAIVFLHEPIIGLVLAPDKPIFTQRNLTEGSVFGGLTLVFMLGYWLYRRHQIRRRGPADAPEVRLANVIRGSLQGMLVHRNLKPLFANQAFADMLGYSNPEEILRLDTLVGNIHPGDRQWVTDRTTSRLAGHPESNHFEVRALRKDGTPILLETLSLMVTWEGQPAVQATYIDITERRKAEENLRLSEISYRTLFDANSRILEHSPAGIILLDHNLRVVYENPGIKRLLAMPDQEPPSNIGLPIGQAPPFLAMGLESAFGKLEQGRKITLETRFAGGTGTTAYLSIKAVPILEDEKLTGAVVLVTDVTERRRYEATLRKQDLLIKGLAEARAHLLSNADLDEAFNRALAGLGRYAGVTTITIYEHHPAPPADTMRLTLTHEWHADPRHARMEKPGLQNISYGDAGFVRWLEELSAGRVINSVVRELPENERRFLESVGILSVMAVPIFAREAYWGFIGFVDRQYERVWTVSEEAILSAVAESIGNFVERKAAEEDLRASEERFRNLVEGSLQGIIVHRDHKLLFVNQAYAEMHGFESPEEVMALGDSLALRAPHERPRIRKYKEARMRGEYAPSNYEIQNIRKDGETIWVDSLHTRIQWDGQPAIQATFYDVTVRKHAEEDLRASEERFRNLIEGSIQGILIHRDFNYLFVNQAYADIFGYDTPEEMMALPDPTCIYPPDERRRIVGYKNARMRGEAAPTRFEFQGLKRDGSVVWLENMSRVINWKGEPAVQATIFDITERKRIEEQLRASEERYRGLARNLPGMVFRLLMRPDGTRCCTYVSPEGLELLSLDPDVLSRDAEPLLGVIHPEDRMVFERVMRESARSLRPKRWEGRYFKPDGDQGWAQVMARPTRHANGDIVWDGLLLVITREKEAENRNLQIRPHGTLTTAAARIVAELKTVVEFGAADFSITGQGGTAAKDTARRAMRASWERASELVHELASFNSETGPEPSLVAFSALLRDVVGRTLRGTDIRYELDIGADLHPVIGAWERLTRLMNDLFLHHLFAMEHGGNLFLKAENVRVEATRAPEGLREGNYVKVGMVAHGIEPHADEPPWPLPPGLAAKLKRARPSLPRVFHEVEACGGRIQREIQPGHMETFTIHLPAVGMMETGESVRHRVLAPAVTPILVMESDLQMRARYRETLAKSGYILEFAATPEDTAELYAQATRKHQPFAAVILGTDPHRTDAGRKALAALREIDPAVKVVAAPVGPPARPVDLEAGGGFVEVVENPFELGRLVEALGRVRRHET